MGCVAKSVEHRTAFLRTQTNKIYTVESSQKAWDEENYFRAARNQPACGQAILHSGLGFHPLVQDLHLFYVSFILATRGTN